MADPVGARGRSSFRAVGAVVEAAAGPAEAILAADSAEAAVIPAAAEPAAVGDL